MSAHARDFGAEPRPDGSHPDVSVRAIHTAQSVRRAVLTPADLAALARELETLDGVARAVVEGPPLRVLLVCDPGSAAPVEPAARALLLRAGVAPEDVQVQVSFAPSPQPRRRVRFSDARLDVPRVGRARATVELEWAGELHAQQMEGESGPAMELRLVGLATLRSLESVLGNGLEFQLVGIKTVRAFDEDMVVAIVRAEQLPGAKLVGAALATGNPHRAAALAVLNATNRSLGNYLANLDG
jgi:hypothetical protein